MKIIYGVIGDPVEHSLSPIMHQASFETLDLDCTYHAFHVKPDDLESAIKGAEALGMGGLNITIPHKEQATRIASPDSLAESIGAINTISFSEGIRGYNTDGYGALRALTESNVKIKNREVLVLGAGGAARAIVFTLDGEGAYLTIANRTKGKATKLAREVGGIGMGLEDMRPQDADIIINTTPVGMHPNTNETLLTRADINSDQVVFDIVYNPIQTRLLREAEAVGATTIDGVKMLVHQGAESERIWLDIEPPTIEMEKAVRSALRGRK